MLLDCEQTAEATAFVASRQGDDPRASDMIKQRARLSPQPHVAHPVACIMKRNDAIVPRTDVGNAKNIDQILAQLIGAARQLFCCCCVTRPVKQFVVQVADHRSARTRGEHHIPLVAQDLDGSSRNGIGIVAEPGIERHLPATRQSTRDVHLDPLAFEQFGSGEPNVGIDLIDDAGNE